MQSGNTDAAEMLRAMRAFLKENDLMAYLTMMAIRLVELHRVLKSTGTLYLHCDPTASHYLKVLMDAIFHIRNFQNEISWKRTTTKSDFRQGAKNWPRIRDVLLHYAKNSEHQDVFHQPFASYSDEYIASKYRLKDTDGRRYMLDNLTAPAALGIVGIRTMSFSVSHATGAIIRPRWSSFIAKGVSSNQVLAPCPATNGIWMR